LLKELNLPEGDHIPFKYFMNKNVFHVTQNTETRAIRIYVYIYAFVKKCIYVYCTVTREKAVKHTVTIKIRKWPHREILSASSSCCM